MYIFFCISFQVQMWSHSFVHNLSDDDLVDLMCTSLTTSSLCHKTVDWCPQVFFCVHLFCSIKFNQHPILQLFNQQLQFNQSRPDSELEEKAALIANCSILQTHSNLLKTKIVHTNPAHPHILADFSSTFEQPLHRRFELLKRLVFTLLISLRRWSLAQFS